MASLKFVINHVINHYAQVVSHHLSSPICVPTMIHFAPTLRCNLRCKYCSIWKEGNIKNELSLSQWKKFLKDLKDWIGEAHVGITGGEPLLREDIIEIVNYMSELKLKTSLTTNATLLTNSLIDKLSNSNIFNINISLESLDKKNHDFFRGKGNFEKTFENLFKLKEALKKTKTLLVIETTLTSKNIEKAKDLLRFCEKNNLKIHFSNIVSNLQVEYGGNFHEESEYKPSNSKIIDEVFDFLIKNKKNILNSTSELNLIRNYYKNKKIKFKCSADARNLFVTSEGFVKLCQYFPPVGNITNTNVRDIWRSDNANKQRIKIRRCGKICQFDCYKRKSLFENFEMYRAMYS